MSIDYKVPFYSNTPDDTHCFQASLRMILKYFIPKKEFSWEKLEEMTAQVEGLWTWPFAGILWMQSNGFEVRDIDSFDNQRFIDEGDKFLLKEFGEEKGRAQIENSDIKQEQRLASEYVQKIATEKRIPNIEDIKKILQDGFLIICNVNSAALNNEIGYFGHSIVVKGFEENKLIIHDPGLPPLENRKVSFEIFEKAWAYPNKEAKNITAFKLKK